MKKWIIVFLILISLIILSVYIFIPSTLKISSVTVSLCTQSGAYRILADTSQWQKWWPSNGHSHSEKNLIYKNNSYTISEVLNNTFKINIADNKSSFASILNLIPLARDSIAVEWQCNISSGNSPLKKIYAYQAAVQIKKNMDEIIDSLKQFLQVPENIYGIKISESSTTDTLLLSTKKIFSNYPSTYEIYKLINQLKDQIIREGSFITGNPMINITSLTEYQFECMAAVPTNRLFKAEGDFFFRRMIPGNFLTTIVEGGESAVANAQKQMEFFISDYQKTSMAISFQSLITDRSAETDTSKWETKLYEPVMK